MFKIPHYLLIALWLFSITTSRAHAVGTWTGGQDTLHVPMSWCIVQGSPAQANPNLAGDTTTDDLIWRRHERPTDNIFINPTGITLRSAINNAWTVLDYPIIADPVVTPGTQQGDMRGEDVNAFGVEFNQMLNACDAVYASPQYGRAGIGVTAVNAGLFHDGAGAYVTVIGWGGCNQNAAGNCVAPYDGRVVVIDNRYLHPASPNRTWPGTATQFSLTDPWDQLVGHEVGHALSLPHRDTSGANLMFRSQQDNDANGTADNRALNTAEVNDLRANAQNVPGLEIDPPGEFLPGRYAVMRQVDRVQEREEVPAHFDLASVRAAVDQAEGLFLLDQQLFGLIPKEGEAQQFWSLLDVDDGQQGADPDLLRRIGAPETRFAGADFVAVVEIVNQEVSGRAWSFQNGELIEVGDFFPELQTLVMYPHFADATGPSGSVPELIEAGVPVHHIVNFKAPAELVGVSLQKPFRVQTFNVTNGEQVVDALDDQDEGRGVEFVLDNPQFPHCFPQTDGEPGDMIQVRLEGLLPNAPIHGLLGADLVFQGKTDERGGGVIDFPILDAAPPGFHLVTVGVDDTALTADCTIHVDERKTEQWPDEKMELLKVHARLLEGQQRLIEQLGALIDQVAAGGNLADEDLKSLTGRFGELVRQHADLLEQLQRLMEKWMN